MIDKETVRKMHSEGKTYRELSEIFGVSYQRIGQICSGMYAKKRTRVKPNKIIYKGVRDWLFKEQITYGDLVQKLGYVYHPTTIGRITDKLHGRQPLKINEIKNILSISGMTFEEAFEEEEHDT